MERLHEISRMMAKVVGEWLNDKLTGQIVITLNLNQGGITGGSIKELKNTSL